MKLSVVASSASSTFFPPEVLAHLVLCPNPRAPWLQQSKVEAGDICNNYVHLIVFSELGEELFVFPKFPILTNEDYSLF